MLLIGGFLICQALGASDADILFYASLERGLGADVSGGNAEPIGGSHMDASFEQAVLGKGMLSRQKRASMQYDAEGNIDENNGTLTFWYYIKEWDPSEHSKEYYNFFHIDAADAGYTYLYRYLGSGATAGLISLVRPPGKEPFFQRLLFIYR